MRFGFTLMGGSVILAYAGIQLEPKTLCDSLSYC